MDVKEEIILGVQIGPGDKNGVGVLKLILYNIYS